MPKPWVLMLRSILCIRKTLNHVATDASTDINVSMIKIGQRQAELLLLRKMITKDIFVNGGDKTGHVAAQK